MQTRDIGMQRDSNKETELESILTLIEERGNLDTELEAIYAKYRSNITAVFLSPEYKEYQKKLEAFMQEYILSPDEMRTIIKEKEANNVSGRELNCSVFDNMKRSDFKEYFNNLINNCDSLAGRRFQVIFQSEEEPYYHWSAADIFVKKDEIEIFHFDTLTAPYAPLRGGSNGNELEEFLKSLGSKIPIKLIDSYTEVKDKKVNIQNDSESCSIFALSSGLTMSKIANLHDEVQSKSVREKESKEKNNVTRYSVKTKDLPANLLRNAQSYSVINDYEKAKVERRSYSKTLKEYADSRSHKDLKTQKQKNIGILFTREHYKNIVKKNKQEKGNLSTDNTKSSSNQSDENNNKMNWKK